jgi:hypothetical protein
MKYIDRLKKAELESIELNLDSRLDLKVPITGDKIKTFNDFCNQALIKMLLDVFGPGDWSQQCLNVAPQAFAILQHHGVPCELVYGEVRIGGTNEFDTTLSGLKKELSNGSSETGMAIHVWINIGKDYIIDPTISARINKHYDSNCPQNIIFCGKASKLKKDKLEYLPMLSGVKFLDITCGIPLEYKSREQSV